MIHVSRKTALNGARCLPAPWLNGDDLYDDLSPVLKLQTSKALIRQRVFRGFI
jgi:hypothetical protein